MRNLVRGGVLLILTSLFVAFIYAQSQTEYTSDNAINSQTIIENNISDNNLVESFLDQDSNNTEVTSNIPAVEPTPETKADKSTKQETESGDSKLVKKTSSVKAVNMGTSRGAFSATAYCLKGKTAMGHGVRRGLIAADPRVLKLGSTVTINAGPWSGTYLVSDTGGRIKGKRLDIWVPSCGEARKFGRRSVQVYSAK